MTRNDILCLSIIKLQDVCCNLLLPDPKTVKIMSDRVEWQSLPDCPPIPKLQDIMSRNVGINTELFLTSDYDPDYFIIGSDGNGIYKYQIGNDNQWTKIVNYPTTFVEGYTHSAFNERNGCIYIFDGFGISEYNSKSKMFKEITNDIGIDIDMLLCINDKIHFLGNQHCIFDNETKKFTKLHDLNDQFDVDYMRGLRSAFHIKSRESILMIDAGGRIYEYSLVNNKWIKWNIRSPAKSLTGSAVLTKDERYVIIFSNQTDRSRHTNYIPLTYVTNAIFIYDFRMRKFMKSKIELPTEVGISYRNSLSITTRNKFAEELLVFGFVNRVYKLNRFKNVQKLPVYLIKFIGKWISIEYVHFISEVSRKHWRICVDAIIENALTINDK